MPWYKSGTVSVASNSNAVIGTGTAFLSNSRVGDAFRGPDGGWYEVTNIASDTAMSISPNYQGATSAAGIYALAPMQGYVKDSADALRALVNTYGAKLAALGTTGNYEILPVAKGGTGGANQADARTNLGIGTAGTRTVQTSVTDNVAGRTLIVGAFGRNGGTAIAQLATVDADTLRTSSFHAFGNGGINLPTTNTAYYLDVSTHGSLVLQEARGMTAAASKLAAWRLFDGTQWQPWNSYVLGGANASITSLTGLTTALSVAQGGTGVTSIAALLAALQTAGAYGKTNAVGTVGQTAGVPTGALMEYGSNANGWYWRFANGLQICIGTLASGGTATTQGAIFVSSVINGSFPIGFAVAPVVVANGLYNASGTGWATQASFPTATTWGAWGVCYGVSNGSASTISLIAVGRWF